MENKTENNKKSKGFFLLNKVNQFLNSIDGFLVEVRDQVADTVSLVSNQALKNTKPVEDIAVDKFLQGLLQQVEIVKKQTDESSEDGSVGKIILILNNVLDIIKNLGVLKDIIKSLIDYVYDIRNHYQDLQFEKNIDRIKKINDKLKDVLDVKLKTEIEIMVKEALETKVNKIMDDIRSSLTSIL